MYAIQMPSGEFLDVPSDLNLTWELNNQVFSTADATKLSGSYSFPTKIKLTPRNRRLLGFPDLVNNKAAWQTYTGVWVLMMGVPTFYGTLTITSANNREVGISVVINQFSAFRDLDLNEFDLGGDRAVSNWATHMAATATNPEDYDYAFFPVFNPEHNDYDPGDPYYATDRSWQNYYNLGSSAFSLNSGAITPFTRVDYLLQRIFTASGFGLKNAWQTSEELRRLYLYHNNDARILSGYGPYTASLPTVLNLQNHVPKIKARDFLKKMMAQWSLGMFTELSTTDITLLPMQTVLGRGPKFDWTPYYIAESQELEEYTSPIRAYNYKAPIEIPAGLTKPQNATQVRTLADLNAAIAAASTGVHWFYSEDGHILIKITKAGGGYTNEGYLAHQGYYPFGDTDAWFDTGMELIRSTISAIGYGHYNTMTKSSHWNGSGTDWERTQEDTTVALMLYRGMQNDGSGVAPLASNHVWLPSGSGGTRSEITSGGVSLGNAQYSLNWFGQYGLYNKFHSSFSYILNAGKHCSMQFVLPVSQVQQFSFQHKVRVGSMDYFLKRLRIAKAMGRGRVLVEASMVSTL